MSRTTERTHARIRLDIWSDDDWREKLSPQAQHLYFVLLTDPSLSYCGVADWRPARIAAKAKGWTPAQVNAAGMELAENLFIVVDEATEEVLIRSYLKHDGLMKQPRMVVSMMTAYAAVASAWVRGVVVHELRKLKANQPDLVAWSSEISGERVTAMLARNVEDPAEFPTGYPRPGTSALPFDFGGADDAVSPSVYPKVNPKVSGSVCGSASPTPTPTPNSSTSNEVESAPKRTRTAATPKTPIEDWMPTPAVITELREKYPHVDLEDEHEKAINWNLYTTGKPWKATQTARDAGFRNWVKRAASSPASRPVSRIGTPSTPGTSLTPNEVKRAKAELLKANPDWDLVRAAGIPIPPHLLDQSTQLDFGGQSALTA